MVGIVYDLPWEFIPAQSSIIKEVLSRTGISAFDDKRSIKYRSDKRMEVFYVICLKIERRNIWRNSYILSLCLSLPKESFNTNVVGLFSVILVDSGPAKINVRCCSE